MVGEEVCDHGGRRGMYVIMVEKRYVIMVGEEV